MIKKAYKLALRAILGRKKYVFYMERKNFKNIALKNPELVKELSENSKFKDIHKGERCFILGNGPSINTQDLSLLENEFVFTVNQIARHKDFEKIKTNYHFWADPAFFELDENKPEDMELLESMKKVNTQNNHPICFFEATGYDFVKKFELKKDLNISFYKYGQFMSENYDREIDFTKAVPSFHTVVQYAIIMAIYMGFAEIYILGCDMTGILTMVTARLEEREFDDQYSYEITEKEKERLINVRKNYSAETELLSFAKMFAGYSLLKEYCDNINVEIYNLTNGGILDSIPRKKYNEVVKHD